MDGIPAVADESLTHARLRVAVRRGHQANLRKLCGMILLNHYQNMYYAKLLSFSRIQMVLQMIVKASQGQPSWDTRLGALVELDAKCHCAGV